jgi:hypothetical protein
MLVGVCSRADAEILPVDPQQSVAANTVGRASEAHRRNIHVYEVEVCDWRGRTHRRRPALDYIVKRA